MEIFQKEKYPSDLPMLIKTKVLQGVAGLSRDRCPQTLLALPSAPFIPVGVGQQITAY